MAGVKNSATAFGLYDVGLTSFAYNKAVGPDIPSGLVDIFNYLLGTPAAGSTILHKYHPPRKSAVRHRRLHDASLMVLLQDMYNNFDTCTKTFWTTHWGELPFGSHAGDGGYPGSGFSAFIYENAPRIKLGLDIATNSCFVDPYLININMADQGSTTDQTARGVIHHDYTFLPFTLPHPNQLFIQAPLSDFWIKNPKLTDVADGTHTNLLNDPTFSDPTAHWNPSFFPYEYDAQGFFHLPLAGGKSVDQTGMLVVGHTYRIEMDYNHAPYIYRS